MKEIGFAAYLSKPVKQRLLYDCLATVLGEHRGMEAESDGIVTAHRLVANHRGHVLVVEDNAVNQMVAGRMVEVLGYSVDIVDTGQKAVEAMQRMAYDFVLMDVQMPVMDGFEATRVIRTPESGVLNPSTPIIAMTASAMKGDRERCLDAGMDDYISKPLKRQELLNVLERQQQE